MLDLMRCKKVRQDLDKVFFIADGQEIFIHNKFQIRNMIIPNPTKVYIAANHPFFIIGPPLFCFSKDYRGANLSRFDNS